MRWILNGERLTATCLSALLTTIAAAAVVTGMRRGQTPAPDRLPSKPKTAIPPPRQFKPNDPAVGHTMSNRPDTA